MTLAHQTQLYRMAIISIAILTIALGQLPALAQKGSRLPTAPDVSIEGPLTVEQAIELALAHQPTLWMARRSVYGAAGAVRQARSDFLPGLRFGSSFSRSMSSGATVIDGVPIGTTTRRFSTQYRSSFSLDQLIYDFGRTSDDLRRSRLQKRAVEHQLAQTEDDVVNAVQQAYLVLLTNLELLEVAGDQLLFQEGMEEWTRANVDAGRIPPVDGARAESARAGAQFDVAATENGVLQSRVALNEAMGIDVRTQYDITPLPEPEGIDLTLDSLIDVAMERRPEVLASRKQLAAADARLKSASKGHAPTITGGASLGWREPQFHPSLMFWGVDVGVNVNLFDGALTEAQEQQARADRKATRDGVYETMERVGAETARSFFDLQTAGEQIVSAEVAVTSADEALRLADGRYRAQVGILLEVLDAQAALTFSRADRARARFDRASARYALERGIGVPLAELVEGAAVPE